MRIKSWNVKFLALFFSLILLPIAIFAHGGKDHGTDKTATVSTLKSTLTHTAKAGNFEFLLK